MKMRDNFLEMSASKQASGNFLLSHPTQRTRSIATANRRSCCSCENGEVPLLKLGEI